MAHMICCRLMCSYSPNRKRLGFSPQKKRRTRRLDGLHARRPVGLQWARGYEDRFEQYGWRAARTCGPVVGLQWASGRKDERGGLMGGMRREAVCGARGVLAEETKNAAAGWTARGADLQARWACGYQFCFESELGIETQKRKNSAANVCKWVHTCFYVVIELLLPCFPRTLTGKVLNANYNFHSHVLFGVFAGTN